MAVNISDYDFEFRPRVKVAHPVIGSISFQDHKWANCVPGESYEVALFDHAGEWIVEPVDPFTPWHDNSPAFLDSAVYTFVPIKIVNDFLWEYNR